MKQLADAGGEGHVRWTSPVGDVHDAVRDSALDRWMKPEARDEAEGADPACG